MTQMLLTKTPDGKFVGASDYDEAERRKLKSRMSGMEPGECLRMDAVVPRNGPFHRKFFAMLDIGFDAWEPRRKKYRGLPVQKNRERFRKDTLIAAGFYDIVATASGGVKHEARSMSFSNMDDLEFERVYTAVADVLLQGVLTRYTRADLDVVVEKLMRFTA
jgi:hypothetical protein